MKLTIVRICILICMLVIAMDFVIIVFTSYFDWPSFVLAFIGGYLGIVYIRKH